MILGDADQVLILKSSSTEVIAKSQIALFGAAILICARMAKHQVHAEGAIAHRLAGLPQRADDVL